MKECVSLQNEYFIQVMRSNTAFYGGNQSWWEKRDERMKNSGCGIIAMCNIELYQQLQMGEHIISCEEYFAYVERRREEDYGLFRSPFLGKLGLVPWRMQRGIRHYSENKQKTLKGRWAPSIGKEKLLQCILDMLEKDLPVTASYFSSLPLVFYRWGECVNEEKEQNKQIMDMRKAGSCKGHYFNITGVVENNDLLYFRISSWGTMYYIKVDDWMKKRSYFTNILYLTKKE